MVLTRLAEADVFATLRISRRDALWQAKAIVANKPMPLFAGDMDGEGSNEPTAQLPAMSLGEELLEDYVALRLSLRAHPIALLRSVLTPDSTLKQNQNGVLIRNLMPLELSG